MKTRPSVGFKSPFKCWMRVDLPEPVWPITPMISPPSISRLTWSTATFSKGVPTEYRWVRFSIFIIKSYHSLLKRRPLSKGP